MHVEIKKLFLQYFEDLCAYAYSFVGDIDASKDIVQEVFYSIWVNREKYIISKAFLYTCVKNESLDYLKSFYLQKKTSTLDSVLVSILENHDERLHGKNLKEEIDNCIGNLPPKCREIFVLRQENGLKNKEISELLGISVKTVEAQISKAILLMKEHLKRKGYFYLNILLLGLMNFC